MRFELTPAIAWLESSANVVPSVDCPRYMIQIWDDHPDHCPCENLKVDHFISNSRARSDSRNLDWDDVEDLETFDDNHLDQPRRMAFR